MRFLAVAAFAVLFSVGAAQAQQCESLAESDMLDKFPPGEFILLQQAPIFDHTWINSGVRMLIGSPISGKFVEIQRRGEAFCFIEFIGDPRKGEPA